MEELLDDLLGVKIHEERNIFKGGTKIPLGTKKPFHYYSGGKIPENQIVYFNVPTTSPNDATSIMCIGKSGTFKTTLLKRILYYYYHLGFKIGVLDLKGGLDWVKIKHHKWSHGRMHPNEKTDTMPNSIVGSAQFALRNFGDELRRKFVPLNLQMRSFAERTVLVSMGFTPSAAEVLLPILERARSVEDVRHLVMTGDYNRMTVGNILLRLNNIERDHFWVTKEPFLMNKYWDNNQLWALGFYGSDRRYLSPYVSKIFKMIFARSIERPREKYFILVDDCQAAFGADMRSEIYESVQLGVTALTQWRFKGINIAFACQSPTLLNREIYNDIKNFFIFRTGSLDALRDYIVNPEIFEVARNLYFDADKKISECIWIREDGYSYSTFFNFGGIIGH